jgi:hypothetical protein
MSDILYKHLDDNGELHREDGPAIEWANGRKEWYYRGELHRENGPAVEHANGNEEYWLVGVEVKKPDVIMTKSMANP